MSDFRPAPRKLNALDNKKLRMSAPNKKGKMASLAWMLVKNNPRLVVYTNDPDDQNNDYGKISANLDAPTFFAFLALLKDAIDAPGQFGEKIENKNFTWGGGKRSDEPVVVNSLIVGKDEDGTIWVCVSAPRRPQLKFPFTSPDFHHFIHRDGSPYTAAEISKIYATAYHSMLSLLAGNLLVTEWVPPDPPKDQNNRGGGGGQGGGGYNRGGGQGGGGGGRPAAPPKDDIEEDMPW